MDTEHLLVLCTCPDADSAGRIATAIIEEKLAACVNRLTGVRSVFAWEGRVEDEPEELLLIKTTREAYPALEARVQALHPYELPELIGVPIAAGSRAYLRWISESVKS